MKRTRSLVSCRQEHILKNHNENYSSYHIRRWDSFDVIAKESKTVEVLSDQSSNVDSFNMLDFLEKYDVSETECFVEIIVNDDDGLLSKLSDFHIPVEFNKSTPFKPSKPFPSPQKLTFDRKSCHINETIFAFDILAVNPEPFVWFDINFDGGDFIDNLIWITEPRTTISLQLSDTSEKSRYA